MSLPPSAGSSAPEGIDERWRALVAVAVDPDNVTDPLGDTIRLFGELGFAGRLADPAGARDQCIAVSASFERMLASRSIPAETVDGFCFVQVPQHTREAMVAAHTAVHASLGKDDSGGIVIDWTARQFGPAPVPLIVTLTDWRAFWRERAARGEQGQLARADADGRAPRWQDPQEADR